MKRKIANSDCEIISFDSTHEELRNCLVIHIEYSKYELVFASGGNVVVKPFSSLMEKNSHTISAEYASLHQTNYSRWTFKCSCLLLPSIVYDQMEEKLSNTLTGAILKDFCLENIECSKYHLIFVTVKEVSLKPFLSCLKKNCLTISLISCMWVLLLFNLAHFDWLPAHFWKCNEVHLIRGINHFNSHLGQVPFCPSLAPYPHCPL